MIKCDNLSISMTKRYGDNESPWRSPCLRAKKEIHTHNIGLNKTQTMHKKVDQNRGKPYFLKDLTNKGPSHPIIGLSKVNFENPNTSSQHRSILSSILQHRKHVMVIVVVVMLMFCPWFELHKVSPVFILLLHTRSSKGNSQLPTCVTSNLTSIHFLMCPQCV